MPPLGLVFAWVLLGEHAAPADLAGIVPVAFGIYLVTRPAPPAPRIGKIAPAGAP
jgi:drug/metabolite transporter (DMT)-like permease